MALRNVLNSIDKVLSQSASDLDIASAGIDAITVKVAKTDHQKKVTQAFTYISKPLDLLISIIVSPIFIIYQTGKDVYKAYKNHGIGWGLTVTVLTPLNLVWKTASNILSINLITTPLNLVLPIGTISDVFTTDKRAMTRIVEMNEYFGFFNSTIENSVELKNIRKIIEDEQSTIIGTWSSQLELTNSAFIVQMGVWKENYQNIWGKTDKEIAETARNQRIVNGRKIHT